MPTRKQRRRRQKLQRHEYEYVIETEEGDEIAVDKLSEHERKEKESKGSPDRRRRQVQKPSMQRVLRRTAIFGPLIFVLVFVTSPGLSNAQKITNALILIAFFIPFSYMVDVIVYRIFQRRQARRSGSGRG